MTQPVVPTPHTSLGEKAQAFWAHFHQGMAVFHSGARTAAVLGMLACAGYLTWSAAHAINHQEKVRAEERVAATTPQVAQNAPLETHIFGPDQKLLERVVWALQQKAGERPTVAVQSSAPSPGAKPENPHPEVTVQEAKDTQTVPLPNFYQPANARDAVEIAKKLGLDLDHHFLLSQRKVIDNARYGLKGIITIPAGGGDVEFNYVPNERPRFGFGQEFTLAAGLTAQYLPTNVPGRSPWQFGTSGLALWRPLRVGDWHLMIMPQWDYLPVLEHPNQLSGHVLFGRTFGDNNN